MTDPTPLSPPAHAGLFISFEGIDGAGKSTHIEGLAQAFRADGRTVTLTREPGGTPLAEKLRTLVLGDAMDPLTESLLVFAARRDHLMAVIEPALARGDVVLCDRFTDATFAYQGGGRGFDLATLGTLETWVQSTPAMPPGQLRQPDLTLWFDLPAATAAARLADARAPDRFEAQPQAFFERVSAGYAARAAAQPRRFARIEAGHHREQVWHSVVDVMHQRGWLSRTATAQGGLA
ncbi:MAG: dTMP kinase [Hydrogenophaga sp.]